MTTPPIWKNISLALGAEPRDYPVVTGSSGLEHRFLSIAVDEATRRIILVSADPDPRMAALTQVDVQSALPEMRILLARPIVLDLGVLSRQLVQKIGSDEINFHRLTATIDRFNRLSKRQQSKLMKNLFGAAMERIGLAFRHVSLPLAAQLVTVIRQGSNLDWEAAFKASRSDEKNPVIPLRGLTSIDNLATDRKFGVCPIPLNELDEDEWTLLNAPSDIPAIREKLMEMGIYQYFFPSPDELAVGFVERGMAVTDRVERAIQTTDQLGHKLSDTSLVDVQANVPAMMKELEEAGYIAEGEFGFEVTPEGKSFRSNFKVRPKESVLTKVINRISVTIDPGSLLR